MEATATEAPETMEATAPEAPETTEATSTEAPETTEATATKEVRIVNDPPISLNGVVVSDEHI